MPPKNNVKVPAIKVANGNYAENWREMKLAKAGMLKMTFILTNASFNALIFINT